MSYSYEDDEQLLERFMELGSREMATLYIEAMKHLVFLTEIVEESETDSHWTNRVEWELDRADPLIQHFKAHLEE